MFEEIVPSLGISQAISYPLLFYFCPQIFHLAATIEIHLEELIIVERLLRRPSKELFPIWHLIILFILGEKNKLRPILWRSSNNRVLFNIMTNKSMWTIDMLKCWGRIRLIQLLTHCTQMIYKFRSIWVSCNNKFFLGNFGAMRIWRRRRRDRGKAQRKVCRLIETEIESL